MHVFVNKIQYKATLSPLLVKRNTEPIWNPLFARTNGKVRLGTRIWLTFMSVCVRGVLELKTKACFVCVCDAARLSMLWFSHGRLDPTIVACAFVYTELVGVVAPISSQQKTAQMLVVYLLLSEIRHSRTVTQWREGGAYEFVACRVHGE
jgi:hypothetical protein